MRLLLFSLFTLLCGCTTQGYTFTGAQIPAAARTFSVGYFSNNSLLVLPSLSNGLTEGLRDRMMRQTRLNQVPDTGDLSFEGEITNSVEAPAAITSDQTNPAAMNRFTVTISVRFSNIHAEEWSFPEGKQFTAFFDYPTTSQLLSIEDQAVTELVEKLVDQIFNASVANW